MTEQIYIIAGTLVVVAALYLLRNVFKRIYQATKFVVMPHKYDMVKKEQPLKFAPLAFITPWLTQISAKAIAYIVIAAIVGTVCFALYHKITDATYSSDYKNNIHNNQDVIVDQRAGNNQGCSVELGFGLIKIGCKQQPITKITNNEVDKTTSTTIVPKNVTNSKPVAVIPAGTAKKPSILIRMAKITGVAAVVAVVTHFVTKIFKKKAPTPTNTTGA
jgi:hypothetical protein